MSDREMAVTIYRAIFAGDAQKLGEQKQMGEKLGKWMEWVVRQGGEETDLI